MSDGNGSKFGYGLNSWLRQNWLLLAMVVSAAGWATRIDLKVTQLQADVSVLKGVVTQSYDDVSKEFQWGEVIEASRHCYNMEEYGMEVRAYDECPEQQVVTSHTGRFLARMGAPEHALKGMIAVFSQRPFYNEEDQLAGVAPDKKHVVVYGVGNTAVAFSHELGHLLLRRVGANPGWLHYAYDECPTEENSDVHACELLEAAQAWYTSELMLSPDSRFLKKFKEM